MKRKGRKKILSNGQKKINLINRNRKSDDDENDSNGQELYLLKKKISLWRYSRDYVHTHSLQQH